jgi:hypothetical protein
LRCRFHRSHRLACHRFIPKPEAFGFSFSFELPTHLNAAGAEKLLISHWLISATLVDFNYLRGHVVEQERQPKPRFSRVVQPMTALISSDESNVSEIRITMY